MWSSDRSKGIAQGIAEQPSDIASTRYQAYLAAGVERWKEYRTQLAPLGKKPVLFVMMNDTAEADDVGDWLRKKYPSEFGGEKLLIIHTDRSGDVSKKDLDMARKAPAKSMTQKPDQLHCQRDDAARGLGRPKRHRYRRPSTLHVQGQHPTEQTVGRGLRLMFRGLRLCRAGRCDRQQEVHRIRRAAGTRRRHSARDLQAR